MSKKQEKKPAANPKITPHSANTQAEKNVVVSETAPSLFKNIFENAVWHRLVIAVLSFAIYANTLNLDFCQDDAIVITENKFTQQGFAGFSGILNHDTFFGFFQNTEKANLVEGGRYRPFSLLMFATEYQFFGKNAPVGHFFNVLYFTITCLVLYALLKKLFTAGFKNNKNSGISAAPAALAFVATLLFTVHPIHTEAVANIKGRDEIIALLGSLAAVWFSLKFYEEKKHKFVIFSFLCFMAGLFSKENAITFVALMPLIFAFFYREKWANMLMACLPFLAASCLFLAVRTNVIGSPFSEPSKELLNNPFLKLEGAKYVPFTTAEKLATVVYTLGKYVVLQFYPHPLTHDYYPRHIGVLSFSDPSVWASLILYGALLAVVIWGWRRRNLESFGLIFYLITLSIVSNLVFAVGTNMAERFIFMPSVGFCWVLAILFARFCKQFLGNKFEGKAIAVLAVPVLLFSLKTIDRNAAWKDNYTLFTSDIGVSSNSAKLQTSVGGETVEKFKFETDSARRNAQLRLAIGHLNRALEIHPPYKNAYLLKGNAYFYLPDFPNAIENYKKALALDPDFADAQQNLHLAYREGGKYWGEQRNDPATALAYLNQAYALKPTDFETLRLLGIANGIGGKTAEAVSFFTKALNLKPDDAQTLWDLGTAYGQAGDIQKAEQLRGEARKKQPNLFK
jgi:protein O-mannosyl-transferase